MKNQQFNTNLAMFLASELEEAAELEIKDQGFYESIHGMDTPEDWAAQAAYARAEEQDDLSDWIGAMSHPDRFDDMEFGGRSPYSFF